MTNLVLLVEERSKKAAGRTARTAVDLRAGGRASRAGWASSLERVSSRSSVLETGRATQR